MKRMSLVMSVFFVVLLLVGCNQASGLLVKGYGSGARMLEYESDTTYSGYLLAYVRDDFDNYAPATEVDGVALFDVEEGVRYTMYLEFFITGEGDQEIDGQFLSVEFIAQGGGLDIIEFLFSPTEVALYVNDQKHESVMYWFTVGQNSLGNTFDEREAWAFDNYALYGGDGNAVLFEIVDPVPEL